VKQDLDLCPNQKEDYSMVNIELYTLFAGLLRYPEVNYTSLVDECGNVLREESPEAASEFKKYSEFMKTNTFPVIQEVYTKTFHIQAICYLDLGYVMFGEDYKRGEFLVNMKKEQEAVNNDCGDDLADNLPNVLTLIPKLTDQKFKEELVVRIVLPSLEKMLKEFESARLMAREKYLKKKHNAILMEGQTNGNIYQYLLKSISIILNKEFGHISYKEEQHDPAEQLHNFLTGCATCSIKDISRQSKIQSFKQK
jgi:nitrate reductase assembly molybdenum cofactor insertion protein NarJ